MRAVAIGLVLAATLAVVRYADSARKRRPCVFCRSRNTRDHEACHHGQPGIDRKCHACERVEFIESEPDLAAAA